jgi:type I restriction enzyme S subunit
MAVDLQLELPLLGTLPQGWRIMEFASVLENGTRNGIYKPKQFHGSGTKIVNMGELFAYPRLRAVPMKRVRLSNDEQTRFDLRVGDLLFARRSLVAEGAGKCSIICEINEPTTFESSLIRARPDPDVAHSMYLYYMFKSHYGAYVLDTIRRQVAVAGITGTDLAKLPIPLPPLTEQRAIAHILGTLDDKIELNQRMNETLEAMARAIFKSWFVDFDPVRAKLALSEANGLEGRRPAGMDAETTALFPDSFEDSSLGKIPKGWKVSTIGDVVEFGYGKALKEDVRRHGPVPVYGSNGQVGWHDEALVKGPGIVVGRKGNPGTVTWAPTDFYPIDTTFYVVPKGDVKSMHYLFHSLLSLNLVSLGADSAVPGLNRNIAYLTKFLIPPTGITEALDKLVAPLSTRVHANEKESRILAAIRDALLPKLLSGEIRVKS